MSELRWLPAAAGQLLQVWSFRSPAEEKEKRRRQHLTLLEELPRQNDGKPHWVSVCVSATTPTVGPWGAAWRPHMAERCHRVRSGLSEEARTPVDLREQQQSADAAERRKVLRQLVHRLQRRSGSRTGELHTHTHTRAPSMFQTLRRGVFQASVCACLRAVRAWRLVKIL